MSGTRHAKVSTNPDGSDPNQLQKTDWNDIHVGPLVLFDHFADAPNSGTGETDLYSDTIAAGQLGANGDKLTALYAGVYAGSGTASQAIKIYFAGTAILTTGALAVASASNWAVDLTIIRVDAATVRFAVVLSSPALSTAVYQTVGELGGLTLAGAAILKITAQASGIGAASNQATAKLGSVSYFPAA